MAFKIWDSKWNITTKILVFFTMSVFLVLNALSLSILTPANQTETYVVLILMVAIALMTIYILGRMDAKMKDDAKKQQK